MHVVRLKLILDLDVQITMVLVARPGVECACDGLALLDCEHVLEVEHGLFPVRVLGVWAGREADRLVACGELNVEPCDDGVDKVAAADLEREGAVEGEVGDGAGVEVEGEDG